MNSRILAAAFILFLVLAGSSCSLAPLTPRVDAASVGKGVFKVEGNIMPSPSIGVIYGAGEKLDIGFDVEQWVLSSAWARYSFINNPNNFSLAANAGVFVYNSEAKSNGYYGGLIASKQWNREIRTTGSFRYAVLDYQYSPEEDNSWFDSDWLEFNNPVDASHNGQIDLTLSYLIKPHVELAFGAVCHLLFKNEDPDQNSEICIPIVGFSYYRQ